MYVCIYLSHVNKQDTYAPMKTSYIFKTMMYSVVLASLAGMCNVYKQTVSQSYVLSMNRTRTF